MRERQRENQHRKTQFKIITLCTWVVHRMCIREHFYTSSYGLTEVLTGTSMLITKLPTLTPKYIPSRNICSMASRFLHRSGLLLRTGFAPSLRTGPAKPIGPNRSGSRLAQPIRPMLSLYLNKS